MLDPAKMSFPASVSLLQFLAQTFWKNSFFFKVGFFQKKIWLPSSTFKINDTAFTSYSEESNPSEKC